MHYRRGIRVWESHRCMVFQEKERKREEKRRGEGEVRFWMNRSFVRCSRVILLRGGCLSDRNSDIKTQYRTGGKKVGGEVGGRMVALDDGDDSARTHVHGNSIYIHRVE